ncbi:MAG: hypothetical protein H7301_09080 [Cryobacterium sp.]|nr:hypothetical protein [Oligoflexia bacterium]
MSKQTFFPILFLVHIVFSYSAFSVNAEETGSPSSIGCKSLLTTVRVNLKKRWSLIPDAHPWVWRAPKAKVDYAGFYEIPFSKTSRLENLPESVRMLCETPWTKIYPRSDPRRNSQPIMELKVVDLESFSTQHDTWFSSIRNLLKVQTPGSSLHGILNVDQISWSNPLTEPAFYTAIDHTAGPMVGRPEELMLKLKISAKKNVFVLALNEPDTEEEIRLVLEKLTGDPNYLNLYRSRISNSGAQDAKNFGYDMYQNAIITYLREQLGIPVDMMLYLRKIGKPGASGVLSSDLDVYAWPIFYDPDLLRNAEVEKVFFKPYSLTPSTELGVNDWKYLTVNLKFLSEVNSEARVAGAIITAANSIFEASVELQAIGPMGPSANYVDPDKQAIYLEKIQPLVHLYVINELPNLLLQRLKLEPEADINTVLHVWSRQLLVDYIRKILNGV